MHSRHLLLPALRLRFWLNIFPQTLELAFDDGKTTLSMSNAALAITAEPPSPHTPGRGQLSRLARQLGNRTDAKRSRWLAGVALPCSDRAGVEETGRSVLTYAGPSFHWRINERLRPQGGELPAVGHQPPRVDQPRARLHDALLEEGARARADAPV